MHLFVLIDVQKLLANIKHQTVVYFHDVSFHYIPHHQFKLS